jgi:hypothetical protein
MVGTESVQSATMALRAALLALAHVHGMAASCAGSTPTVPVIEKLQPKMTRIFSICIIALIVGGGILAVCYTEEHQAMDKTLQDEGNGIFHQKKRDTAAVMALAAEMSGYSNPPERGAYGETTGVSGPPSVGQIILPQSTLTKSANLAVPTPAPTR